MGRKLYFLVNDKLRNGVYDAAYLLDNEDPRDCLIEQAAQTIAHEVEISVNGVTLPLAAFIEPEEYAEQWEKLGIEDVDEFLTESIGVPTEDWHWR